MFKVLIVEDEPPILRSIMKKITQAHSGFEIVSTAYNGKDALDYLRKFPVDVVLTDINMPICNGIELLKGINEFHLPILTLMLSGYQDFSYAQQALKLGAYDYLLKPLDLPELKNVLDKIYHELEIKKQAHTHRYLLDIANDQGQEKHVPSSIALYPCCLFLICAGSFSTAPLDYLSTTREYWEQIPLERLIKSTMREDEFLWVIPGKTHAEKLIICSVGSNERLKEIVSALYNKLISPHMPITIMVNEKTSKNGDIPKIYAQLRRHLYEQIVFGYSQLLYSSNTRKNCEYNLPSHTEQKLLHSMEQNNFTQLKKELLLIGQEWQRLQLKQLHIESLLKQILLLCKKTLFIQNSISELEFDASHLISQYYTYDTLIPSFIELIKTYHNELSRMDSWDKEYLVLQLEDYIKTNMSASITNQTLADAFGLVSTYISKLFKKYKGVSPSEYLLSLRIEKAKEMLIHDPDLLAKDIAEIVGYADPLYFSRVFKKVTGMYPSDYRKHFL